MNTKKEFPKGVKKDTPQDDNTLAHDPFRVDHKRKRFCFFLPNITKKQKNKKSCGSNKSENAPLEDNPSYHTNLKGRFIDALNAVMDVTAGV